MTVLDFKRLKILLIDDEAFVRSILRQVLSSIGVPSPNIYEADSAASGMLETMRIRPALVFCDIHMPAEDGLQFLAKLRKAPAISATPVVMITSDSSESSVVSAKGLKADGYVVKPVSVSAVQRALDFALRPAEAAPPPEDQGPSLIIKGKSEDLRMIAGLIRELYQVEITCRF